MASDNNDGIKPQAVTIPDRGYFKYEQETIWAGFSQDSRLSRLHDHRESQAGKRVYGATLKKRCKRIRFSSPSEAPLREVARFDIGTDKYLMYQGIFDTDFDKYTDDAVALFTKAGLGPH
jgi:hypothetical protein